MNKALSLDTVVIMDSFPSALCPLLFATIEYEFLKGWQTLVTMRRNTYGSTVFKVHMLLILSGCILNYVVMPASVHDLKVVDDLLEGYQQAVILADLGYLSQELKTT